MTKFSIETFEPSAMEGGKPEPQPLLQIPGDYKKWVREFHSSLPTDQLAWEGKAILISLPQVYIPLETSNPFYKSRDEKPMKERKTILPGELQERGADSEAETENKEPMTIDIEELMGRVNCLLLEGNAGMGKTTLIKHLAYSLTHDSGPLTLSGYLPIPVFLKDLWLLYREQVHNQDVIVTFELLLEVYFKKYGCPLTLEIVKGFLLQGRALVLLDGLDEVPEAVRDYLVDLVQSFRFEYSRNETPGNRGNRFLITGRPQGMEGRGMQCFGKYHRKIEYLGKKTAETFISRWFRALSGQAGDFADLTAREMIADLHPHEYAPLFTRDPLLLTILCIFYWLGGKRIPDQRADLYDRVVAHLLYRRFHDPSKPEKVNQAREFLMLLAFNMQTRHKKKIEPYGAIKILEQQYPAQEGESTAQYKKRLEKMFNEIEPVCGLLNRQSSGEIEFVHLSFQEFLAAKYMLDMEIHYRKYLEDPWWEETLLLYLGSMNLEMKKPSNKIVHDILKLKPLRFLRLGARALLDFQPSRREEALVKYAREKLIVVAGSQVSPGERFEAGEFLGRLGDSRVDGHSPLMVRIEAGAFTRGSNENDDEKPVTQVYLDAFMMGKYPVTNEEFKAFILEKGYEIEEYWSTEGWQWRHKENCSYPGYWHDRKWNGPNFPVVGISWYEAAAYAKWLSRKTGENYTLPTEAQWEKVARGTKGFIYPWGNTFYKDLCNSSEGGLDRTSPVGIFPPGQSACGCMDMAGNVREWCRDWYDKDYYKEGPKNNPPGPAAGLYRVLRGGAWIDDAPHCRAAYRGACLPTNRDVRVGFRLVKSI